MKRSFRLQAMLASRMMRRKRSGAALAIAALATALAMPAGAQVIYTYQNGAGAALPTSIPEDVCTATSGGITRTFTVPETFSVNGAGAIALGVDITHTDREQVRIFLDPPGAAAAIQVTPGLDDGTDRSNNYRVMFSSNADTGNVLDDGTADPVVAGGTVLYRRLVTVAALDGYTGAVNGDWTLRVCDIDTDGDPGTLNSARLVLRHATGSVSAATCGTTSSFDWASNGGNVPFTSTVINGVTLSQLSTSGEPPSEADPDPSYRTWTGTQGAHAGYYWLRMDTSGNTKLSAERSTFEFSVPVTGLSFSFLDVDRSVPPGTGWEDYVRIEAEDATGAAVAYQMTLVGAQLAYGGDWVEADASVDTTSTDGNVDLRFDRPVRRLIIQYAQGNEPNTDSVFQIIGISDFQFCAFDYGDAPPTYGVALTAGGTDPGDGPRHVVGTRALFIGTAPDGESNGVASTPANSDDATNSDEGAAASLPFGIPAYVPQGGQVCNATAGGGGTFTTAAPPGINPNEPGQYCLVVNVTKPAVQATLVGWIDFNGNGIFDAGERSNAVLGSSAAGSFIGGNLAAGALTGAQRILVWTNVDPGGAQLLTSSQTYLRLRVSSDATFIGSSANPLARGLASDGEVEDHVVAANTLPVTLAHVDVQRVDAGTLSIAWTTATETGTRGFRVLQQQADRRVALVSQRLVPSARMSTTRPTDYRTQIATASNGPIYLEEISVNGKVERFGPFAVGATMGARPQVSPAPWAIARSEAAVAIARDNSDRRARGSQRGTGPAAELRVSKTGWQRVAVSALTTAGIDFAGQPVAGLRLRRGDVVVPVRVAGAGATLTASSEIEFWGEAVADNLYTTERPYLLDTGPGGQFISVEDGTPLPGPAATIGSAVRALDADRDYSVTAPNGDPWYFDMITRDGTSTAGKQWTLDLPGADTNRAARISVSLWGGVGIPELAQDHRYRLSLNGAVIGEDGFDGVTTHDRLFEVPAGVLVAGANTVRLDLIDTGDSFDRVFIERISIAHTARLAANDGYVSVTSSGFVAVPERVFGGGFEAGGIDDDQPVACGLGCEQLDVVGLQTSDVIALRLRSNGAAELAGVDVRSVAGGYAARVRAAALGSAGGDSEIAADRIVVIDRARSFAPSIRPAIALDDPAIGGPNDLMIIASTRFAGSVGDLVAAREAEGLRVRVVTVDQIYAHYSDGIVDPEGIRRFVARAAQQLGTRYVLLVGGDTYDYFDRYATGSISDVPTLYRNTHEYVSFAPVDPAFGDIDDDGRPDVAVGRLPARTTAELQSLIVKVLEPLPANAYTGLFAAERSNPAEGIDYDARVSDWVSALGPAWQSGMSRLNLDDYPATAAGTLAARNEFIGQVNQGRNWVSYYGHASPATWSREALLDADFLPGLLNNAGKSPVVTEFGCWGGYFVEPTYTTLNHAWLLSPGRGARAMIASSSLTEALSDQAIAAALVPQFSTPGIRLGDALLNAQGAVYSTRSEMKDVIYGMSLFGDPSARLTPPN